MSPLKTLRAETCSIRRTIAALVFASAVCASPSRAAAEPADAASRAEAKRLFEGAEEHYHRGDFQAAVEGYTRAYELFRRPAFLFNIGQCYRNLNQPERAADYYGLYLAEIQDPAERQRVSDLITSLHIDGPHDTPKAADRSIEPGAARTEAATPIELRPTSAAMSDEPDVSLDPEPAVVREKKSSPVDRWWFWTLIGVGALAVAGGVVLATRGSSSLPDGSLGTFDYR